MEECVSLYALNKLSVWFGTVLEDSTAILNEIADMLQKKYERMFVWGRCTTNPS
jgi:hypothetical protein